MGINVDRLLDFQASETQYFGSVDYFKELADTKYIKIEQWENFSKSTLRNRCFISGSNGRITLTVPVQGGREQRAMLKDMRVDTSTDWKKIHCRSIQSSYARAPFYEYYCEDVYRLISKPNAFLLDMNMEILNWALKALKLNTQVQLTTAFTQTVENGKNDKGKEVPSNNWTPIYQQVFQDKFGFLPNLSILDLLFCEGPNAGHLLQLPAESK
jgi:hypothetical protein